MKDKPEYKIVTSYTLEAYPCGIQAGNRVKLKHDLTVRDSNGEVTSVHPAGEVWQVLTGVTSEPETIWLRQPDGERHTWDDYDFLESFEVLSE